MICEQSRNVMTEALYSELAPAERKEFEQHIASCPDCASAFERMQSTLRVMDQRRVVPPDERFLDDLWRNIESAIDSEKRATEPARRKFHLRPSAIPAWAYGVAAVILIALGFYLGRIWIPSGSGVPETTPYSVSETGTLTPADSLEQQTLAYLERSRNLLLGVVNRPEHEVDRDELARQQVMSQKLIEQASFLKTALARGDQQRLRQLVLDLEIVLLQLANIESDSGVPAIELVREGVDRKSILLKINLEVMRSLAKARDRKNSSEKSRL